MTSSPSRRYIEWLLTTMKVAGKTVVDVDAAVELEYAQHCTEADAASAPLRYCISYYNGEGEARPHDHGRRRRCHPIPPRPDFDRRSLWPTASSTREYS
jgi:hypothetical protein